MARRRRGASIKSARQSRKIKKNEKVNGLLPSNKSILDDSSHLIESETGNSLNDASICISSNCFETSSDPVVHHKKFGKIRVSGQNENSLDVEPLMTEANKDYNRFDSKSSDENECDNVENNTFSNDVSVLDIMRGIEITGAKAQNSFVDFRKQSSVYKAENDIPLDGSVIIKPGTFSSNTITSSVKPNLFFDTATTSEINSVNFLKVLQGIEMLERNVSGSSVPLEFGESLPKQEKDFLNTSTSSTPVYFNEESGSKILYADDELPGNCVKSETEELNNVIMNVVENSKIEDNIKKNISSPEDTSSDIQNETEETTRKLQSIGLDEQWERYESPASKASDETSDKKAPAAKSRTGSTDAAETDSNSNLGGTIRRSNRIRSIGIMKQKEREQAAVKSENVLKSPMASGSPAVTPPVPAYDDKPVKVKSRWRRSSELEMHCGKVDSESVSSTCSSPVSLPFQMSCNAEPSPEDLEKLEREKKEIEEGLKSFTVLTENEYKMER